MNVAETLKNYTPYNEQEEKDKSLILALMENNGKIFTRESAAAHITVSAWLVNKARTKVLMAFHNIYNSWAWLGGHADGETDLLGVAIREAKEESGVKTAVPVFNDIFSVEVLPVEGHIKRGKYVSSHLHLNFTYLLEGDESERLAAREGENSSVAWLTFDEVMRKSTEPWFCENIYSKLIKKLNDRV